MNPNNIGNNPSDILAQQRILADAPLEVCPECGCKFYDEVVVVKKINGLMVGSPNEYEYSPVPVYICHNCHRIGKWVLESRQAKMLIGKNFGVDNETEKHEEQKTPSGIIIP